MLGLLVGVLHGVLDGLVVALGLLVQILLEAAESGQRSVFLRALFSRTRVARTASAASRAP